MKTYQIYKNGGFETEIQFDINSDESFKQACLKAANANVNANYELKIINKETGKSIRTYSN